MICFEVNSFTLASCHLAALCDALFINFTQFTCCHLQINTLLYLGHPLCPALSPSLFLSLPRPALLSLPTKCNLSKCIKIKIASLQPTVAQCTVQGACLVSFGFGAGFGSGFISAFCGSKWPPRLIVIYHSSQSAALKYYGKNADIKHEREATRGAARLRDTVQANELN